MANLKAVKRKMSKWGVLGNAFLSVVLALALIHISEQVPEARGIELAVVGGVRDLDGSRFGMVGEERCV